MFIDGQAWKANDIKNRPKNDVERLKLVSR